MAIFRGMSPDAGFDGNGDCCGVRVCLLMRGGFPTVVDVGAAAGDDVDLGVGFEASLESCVDIGGPK